MVLAAGGLTGTISLRAIRYAVCTPLCADEVWQRLAVLRHVRALAIGAYTGVSEGVGVAFVLSGLGAVGGGLEADTGVDVSRI